MTVYRMVMVNQQMRSTTNLLIINLAVSDILFVIFCVPFTATDYMLPEWPFGDPWCKYVQYMIVVTCHCSVYTLVLMSFDRFLAVVHPVTSMSLRTERNASMAIIMAWVLIVTTAIPVALAHSVRYYHYRGRHYTACVFSSDNQMWSHLGFQICVHTIHIKLMNTLSYFHEKEEMLVSNIEQVKMAGEKDN
ncbi:hypothetical protein GQX74_011655 [Glossina fuscipes]|nr:hypothetical protein GQX74_011655 [Glossina fuscipes]